MTITARILNKKRHTVGFVVGREEVTRAAAIKLARKGQIKGVRIAKGPQGPYLVSDTDTSLYSLPTRQQVARSKKRPAAAAKKLTATAAKNRKSRTTATANKTEATAN